MNSAFQVIASSLFVFGWIVNGAFAGGREPAPVKRSDDAKPTIPILEQRVLSLVPADAFFVAFTADVDRAMTDSLGADATASVRELVNVRQALAETFHGPAALSISGTTMNPFSWRISIVSGVEPSGIDVMDSLREALVPSVTAALGQAGVGAVQFVESAELATLSVSGPVPMNLNVATTAELVVLSNDPTVLLSISASESAEVQPFTDRAEFKRLRGDAGGRVDHFAYLDLRTVVPLAAIPMQRALPKLYEALQLDRVESIGLMSLHQPIQPTSREGESDVPPMVGAQFEPLHVRAAVGLKGISAGPWHFLAPRAAASGLARYFPPDTALLAHGSMESAAELVDDMNAVAAVIDQVIVDEYLEERATFQRDFGFDPHRDFLANLGPEWAVGSTLQKQGPGKPLIAIGLHSVERFRGHWQVLRTAFRLETDPGSHKGVTIETARTRGDGFSFAVVGDALLVSRDRAMIESGIDAFKSGESLDREREFQRARLSLPPATSKLAYVDMGRVMASEFAEEKGDIPPELRRLASLCKSAMLSVTPASGAIAVDMVTDGSTVRLMAQSLTASTHAAREQALRAVSAANMRGLLTSCAIYAHEHKKAWPASLDVLVADGSVTAEQLRVAPSRDSNLRYLYRAPKNPPDPKEVVLAEPELHGGGANFGFVDGHIEWIVGARAEELLDAFSNTR